jgi:hypothetical protein
MTSYFFLARGDGEFEVRCRHGASQSHRFASEQSLVPGGWDIGSRRGVPCHPLRLRSDNEVRGQGKLKGCPGAVIV